MIKDSELRIGNFYNHVDVGQITLSAQGVNHFVNSNSIEGISLTKEWLERFKFSLVKASDSPFLNCGMDYWVKNAVVLFFNESPPENTYLLGFAECRFGVYQCVTRQWIREVHELQNAYSIWTGQEIE